MDLPDEVTEDLETDYEWMRQILVLRRVCDLLLALKSKDPQEPVMLAIDSIRPLPSENCGAPSNYVREYPVELVMDISLEGLSQFLQKSSLPKTLQIIRAVQLKSDPHSRRSRHFHSRSLITKKGKEWYSHYYRVRIVCATAVPFTEKQRKQAIKNTSSAKTQRVRRALPLPH